MLSLQTIHNLPSYTVLSKGGYCSIPSIYSEQTVVASNYYIDVKKYMQV